MTGACAWRDVCRLDHWGAFAGKPRSIFIGGEGVADWFVGGNPLLEALLTSMTLIPLPVSNSLSPPYLTTSALVSLADFQPLSLMITTLSNPAPFIKLTNTTFEVSAENSFSVVDAVSSTSPFHLRKSSHGSFSNLTWAHAADKKKLNIITRKGFIHVFLI